MMRFDSHGRIRSADGAKGGLVAAARTFSLTDTCTHAQGVGKTSMIIDAMVASESNA